MVLPTYDVMSRVDTRLRHASAALGAGPFTTFWCVYLPLTLPGVAAGSIIVFIASMGYYVLPSLLGGAGNMMIGQMIYQDVTTNVQWGLASAVATVLFVVALGFFVLFIRVTRRRHQLFE
jgi:ABC-type spermidine/putrescine transport system permease subunit I